MDLSDVSEEITYEIFPPGKYAAEVSDIEFGESQSSGKPMLTWHVDVEGQTTAGNDATRTLRYYTVLEGNGLSRLKKLVNKLLEEADEEPYDWAHFRASEIIDMFIGTEVTAVIRVGRDRVDPKIKRNNISDLVEASAAPKGGRGGFADE